MHVHTSNHYSSLFSILKSCPWEYRAVRHLIKRGRLAARLKGKDERQIGTEQQCPICMLEYDEINMLKCCRAMICTECYLQVQDPSTQSSECPFCKNCSMSVTVAKRLDVDDVAKRDNEEQQVIEAEIRARKNRESASIQPSITNPDIDSSSSESDTQTGSEEIQLNSDIELLSNIEFERQEPQIPSNTYLPNHIDYLDETAQYLHVGDVIDSEFIPSNETLISELSDDNQLALAIQKSLMEY